MWLTSTKFKHRTTNRQSAIVHFVSEFCET